MTHCAHARFVWNLCIEQESQWRAGRGRMPGLAERCRQLTEARAENAWLAGGSAMVQQQAIRDHDQAMTGFFNGTYGKPLAVIAGTPAPPLARARSARGAGSSRGRLRDLVDELDRAHLLVGRHALGDERDHLLGGDRRAATTNAFGTSPASSSGTPITAASAIAGWVSSSASSSAGATW